MKKKPFLEAIESGPPYTRETVRRATLDYFDGDELATDVWVDKYALQDQKGSWLELTPVDMHRRLAKEFARIESKYPNPMSEEEIYGLLADWRVVPQGSPMSAIGNPYQIQSLSNCVVLESPSDSYGGICKTDQEQAQVMKRRGGVGFDISTIRPKGLAAANAARTTDGIGVFMDRFSNTCGEVAQGGRRGALMLTISVHHPDVLTFANIKRDRAKVTRANVSIRATDEFMRAVKAGMTYQQRFPVDPNVSHLIEHDVDARAVYDNINAAARDCSEPGWLFWDTVTSRSPADAYEQFKTVSTNPCLHGDTIVAVADGRGYVPIRQLAEEGLDVPVYTHSAKTGKMVVRTMRNPRLTGKQMPVFRVTIEGGHSFVATSDHKMIMHDGSEKAVCDMRPGDQLMISKRTSGAIVEKNRKTSPYVMIENAKGSRAEHRLIWEHHHGAVASGMHVHHVNFDPKDNRIENLACMDRDAHAALHAPRMRGENNPIFKIKADPERFAEYSAKMSQSTGGARNGRAYAEVTDDDLRAHMLKLTRQRGYRVSNKTWMGYAKDHGLPQAFSAWRRSTLGTVDELATWAAKEIGLANVEADPRLQEAMLRAKACGYDSRLVEHRVMVTRACEQCSGAFEIEFSRREQAFCSQSCSLLYGIKTHGANVRRTKTIREVYAKKAEGTRRTILNNFTELRMKLGREPMQIELQTLCKERGQSYRTGTKFGFADWDDVRRHAASHNHRVLSVEPAGHADVYNGTVDEEHTFCIGGWNIGNGDRLQLHSKNCGEITLSANDACRLMLMNLSKYVAAPFTTIAEFAFDLFESDARKAQRLMDDLVDLELEAIDKILAKIDSDPEPEDVKSVEREVWEKLRKSAYDGRRTGLGITALGDAFAMLGIVYGSPESVALTERIYRALALGAYRSSVTMAEERGAFPVFNHTECGHPFLRQIWDADQDLAKRYAKHGRRNVALTTTAPAGSTSILTQTTSGCEPVLFVAAKRNRKINPGDKAARVDWTDATGDAWQTYDVFHHGVKRWMEVTGETDVSKSPYFGSTVEEIDPLKKVDIQAAAQKWICHSISNTTNLPTDVTTETVSALAMRAWETGCKGVTIYRIGSRDAVIRKDDAGPAPSPQPSAILPNHAPKRPAELECDIHRASIQGQTYLVLVGLLGGAPYEIFAGLSDQIEVPKKVRRGGLVKNGRDAKTGLATYNLRIPLGDDDELVFKDVAKMFDNHTYGAFTRTISLALRHGAPLQYLVEQLRKDKHSDITSFSAVIARVLSKGYIKDGTKTAGGVRCERCGAGPLAYQQGCVTCLGCGASKCG